VSIASPVKPESFTGKHVLLVEDIHDTGRTLEKTVALLNDFKPKSVEVAVLVVRPDKPRRVDLRFVGMECGGFIIGYGLDYDEHGRHYQDIYQKVE
jgi:hypoxanthine phosphoribosyltransferase